MIAVDTGDLAGYPLTVARERLAARGIVVSGETELCPPWPATGAGVARVVRVTPAGDGVHLTYAHRTYRRPERSTENSRA